MDEEQELPKKIALKVPSLFIKSSSSTPAASTAESDNGSQKKPARPMPASVRKKLEEAKQNESISEKTPSSNSSDVSVSSSNETPGASSSQKKPSRPMPASARRKLEETTVSGNDNLSDVTTQQEESKRTSKPMPASAKLKLLDDALDTKEPEESDNHVKETNETAAVDQHKLVKKPMPASARRRVEESSNEIPSTVTTGGENLEKSKVKKPMPASAKRELEGKANDFPNGKPEKADAVHIDFCANPIKTEIKKKPMPASVRRRKLEEENSQEGDVTADIKKGEVQNTTSTSDDDDETKVGDQTLPIGAEPDRSRGDSVNPEVNEMSKVIEAEKESKKINISLGGIKFPTFKKPMPASAKRKVEDKLEKGEKTTEECEVDGENLDVSGSDLGDKDQDTVGESLRSSRRRSSGHGLLELGGEKFPCEICGSEFYRLSDKVRHEKKAHLERNEQGETVPKKKSDNTSSKQNKKPTKESKYKGMKSCPHCDKPFNNWKKIAKHATLCVRPSIPCLHCDKTFKYDKKLEAHLKTHKKIKNDFKDVETEDAVAIPLSNLDFNDDATHSPMSVDSKDSSKNSVVEKPKPMPKSMKAKLQKDDEGLKKTPEPEESPKSLPKSVQSFKRKIADVLSTLGSRRFNNLPSPTENDYNNDEEADGPPRKKSMLSKEGESIRGHPMPASVKKKLEDRGNKSVEKSHSESVKKKSTKVKSSKVDPDLDDLECEVCHKVFSGLWARRKHEKNIHSIKHPRGRTTAESPQVSKTTTPDASPKAEASKSKTAVAQLGLDLSTIPKRGICPICSQSMTNLKRHIRNVHKIDLPKSSNTAPVKPAIRPSAPKSYKIYKTAANKIKHKLASSVSAKKPVTSLENRMPIAKVAADMSTQVKTESKVIASTASSDLRCACCDEIFEVKCDFYEHMTMEHSKLKRFVNCKLCDHKFSHEEDFFLHIQFKHPNVMAGMKQKTRKSSSKKPDAPAPVVKIEPDKQSTSSTRSTRKSTKEKHSQSSTTGNVSISKSLTITISPQDRKQAESALKKLARKKHEAASSRSTRRSSVRKSPEPMEDSFYEHDDHFDDSGAMEIEEESEIAITSTFSQKVASPQKQGTTTTASVDLDAMHCSTCSEVFYSFEALRKHELYFHNVKTTKMCPICGVYPTRLSRHLLAHENKTVRCSCVPCRLSFPEFSELLKHNLEKHPGEDGGALCAPNKPRDEIPKAGESNGATDEFRCLLCDKEFIGIAYARRHISRTHSEQEGSPDNLLEKVAGKVSQSVPEVDEEVAEILEDTSKKLLDPDWDADDDDVVEVPKAPSIPTSGSRKSSRPMPASARAKLQIQQEEKVQAHSTKVSGDSEAPKPGGRPMPASVRAKLEAQKKALEESTTKDTTSSKTPNQSKPSRPMPASVRAKLASQSSSVVSVSENSRDSSTGSNTSKPRRPMPASVRAKLGISQSTGGDSSGKTEAVGNNSIMTPDPRKVQPKGEQNAEDSSEEIICLDDDHVDDSFPEPEEPPEPLPPSIPTFSIADEIAEHNRAVQIAMGEHHSTGPDFNLSNNMFQCKLCNKKFESLGSARKHFTRFHSEYGPDHAENMIARLYEEYVDTPRRRRSNVRYNEDYLDDDDPEPEVIIYRGTTRRPRGKPTDDTDWISPKEHSVPAYPAAAEIHKRSEVIPLAYACKWCGQRKDTAANVRRHISKAHPHLSSRREEGVVIVGSNTESQPYVVESQPSAPPPPPKPSAGGSKTVKAGNPIYVCKVCSRCMTILSSMRLHISKSHPEVEKGKESQFIQELNGNGDNSNSKAALTEVENSNSKEALTEVDNSENSYYCSICSYQTADEHDYVRHYKSHTGVSPYQCQYCSATFNRQKQLNEHLTREHTGAEFLTNYEAEISMEEVVGSSQISVATSSKIHIDSPKTLSLNRRYSTESNGHSEEPVKKYTPGPASRKVKTAAARKSLPPPPVPVDDEEPMDTENSPPVSPPAQHEEDVANDEEETDNQQHKHKETPSFYQGDLSSLFPTLGGGAAPGGIDALDDIDGGMSLD